MKNFSFRNVIIFSTFILFLLFSVAFFAIFNNYYFKDTKEKSIEENKYYYRVIQDFIEEKKEVLSRDAKNLVIDKLIFHAIVNKIYYKIPIRRLVDSQAEESRIKIGVANRIDYINLVNHARIRVNGSNDVHRKEIQLLDYNLDKLANSKGIIGNDLDDGNDEFLKFLMRGKVLENSKGSMSVLVEKNNKIFIKGIDRFYATEFKGVAIVSEEFGRDLIEDIKNKVNRDVILIKDKSIYLSTIYINQNGKVFNLENYPWNIKLPKKYNGKTFYKEAKINENYMGFTFFPLLDYKGEIIAHIGLGFTFDKHNDKTNKFILFEIVLLIIILIILYFLLRKLFSPFNNILNGINKIQEGDYKVSINKPTSGELKLIADGIEQLSTAVAERETKLIELNKNLEEKVYYRTISITNLLNNAGQGFLTFNKELIIGREYSTECKKVFGQDISGMNFSEIVFEEDNENKSLFINTVFRIFMETHKLKKKILFSLLPTEYKINNSDIELEFKSVVENDEQKIMVILTDITDRKELEFKMEDEKNHLKMITRTVIDFTEFKRFVNVYRDFYLNNVFYIISDSKDIKSAIGEIYRKVHTFKGGFSQFYMQNISSSLHNLENKISELFENSVTLSKFELIKFIKNIEFSNFLETDLNIIKDSLGENFLNQDDSIIINKSSLKEIERKILTISNERERNILLMEIRKFSFKSLKLMLKAYPEYTYDLAKTIDKSINRFKIQGDDLLIDPEKYSPFINSLVNIFRNIIDHGIETIDERVKNNKDEKGNISCEIKLINKQINIIIKDDGAGINLEKVQLNILKLGIYSEEEVKKLNEKEILKFLFWDTLSTKEEVSKLSGRGVGLSAVKKEIERLNGDIIITTVPKEGTTFTFVIPYIEEEIPEISVANVLNKIFSLTKVFISNEADFELDNEKLFEKVTSDHMALFDITTSINIKGSFKGKIILSVENDVAIKITRRLFFEELEEEEIPKFLGDSISEMLNVVVGNVTDFIFKTESDYDVYFSSPDIIYAKDLSIKYAGDEAYEGIFETKYGKIKIAFIKNYLS